MNSLSVPHLIGIRDLTTSDINTIFTTADSFKDVINRPIKKVPSLRDITIANIFFENCHYVVGKNDNFFELSLISRNLSSF